VGKGKIGGTGVESKSNNAVSDQTGGSAYGGRGQYIMLQREEIKANRSGKGKRDESVKKESTSGRPKRGEGDRR